MIDFANGRFDEAAFEIETDVDPLEPSDEDARRQAQAEVDAEESRKRQSNGRGGKSDAQADDKTKPKLHCAASLLDQYLGKIKSGDLLQLIRLRAGLDGIELGQGLICVIGAPPGLGKTAFAMQCCFDAIEFNEGLPCYIANAEMSFDSLLRRQLVAMTRVKSDDLRFGRLRVQDLDAVQEAAAILRPRLNRVSVCDPCDHESLLDLLDKPPGLVICDYLQKFAPAGGKDIRAGVNTVMATLRRLASHGHAVLALSATKRDPKGRHDSKELDLSSFRESGEIEYNADSCYVLQDHGPIDKGCNYIRITLLGCVKNRHSAPVSKLLEFHRLRMEFTPHETEPERHAEFDEWQGDNPFDDDAPRDPF